MSTRTFLASAAPRWTRRLAPVLLVALLAGCAAQRLHDEGLREIAAGDRQKGLQQLRQASAQDPTNPRYRLDLLNQQTAYARELVTRADETRQRGEAEQARALYQQALAVSPGLDRALAGLAALEQDAQIERWLVQARQHLKDKDLDGAQAQVSRALGVNGSHAGALALQRQLGVLQDQANSARAERTAAASVMRRAVTLQFRDSNLRLVFEALARTTGLNVVLDRDVKADLKTTIFVKDAAVEDAVDLILLQNQLEKKVLNGNTLFVYPSTPAKQKEYQDLIVRTFQISSGDPKHIQSVLKTMLKIKDVLIDERNGTLVLRDTSEAIAVATKVIAAHDVAEPEVMLEVEVLEVSRDRLSNIGVKFPEGISVGTPGDANGQLTVGALRNMTGNSLLVNKLDLGVNFRLQDTEANLLSSPRLRARNKEKARVLIGDRVPIITNTVTPVTTGGAVVTGSVQYQEVGLKLDFEPQVYSDQEVGIRVSLEVSSITREIAGPSGSLAYQIGTRNASTALRLRDGETQVLAGLISDDERDSAAKLPGVGHLPMVGRLFGNNTGSGSKKEIVLSITPRIIRPPAVAHADTHEVFSGTESSIRSKPLRLDPVNGARAHGGSAQGAAGSVGGATAGGAGSGGGFSSPGGSAATPDGAGGSVRPAGALDNASAGKATSGSGLGAAAAPGSNSGAGTATGTVTGSGNGNAAAAPGNGAVTPADPPKPIDRSTIPPAIRPGAIYKPATPPAPATPPPTTPPPKGAESVKATVPGLGLAPVLAGGELQWKGPTASRIGDPFVAELTVRDAPAQRSWNLVVRWDPLVLGLVDVAAAPGVQEAGGKLGATRVDVVTGRAEVSVDFDKAPVPSATQALLALTFAAKTARAQTQLLAATLDGKGEGPASAVARATPLRLRTSP
jgi:general secretion pathway protein D